MLSAIGKGMLGDVARSPDGELIAMIDGKNLHWLDAVSGEELGSVNLGEKWFDIYAFSPNNRYIIVSEGFGARVVDTTRLSVERCCYGDGDGGPFGFTFSIDSHYLAYTSADHTSGGPYHFVDVLVFNLELERLENIETQTDRLNATQSASNDYIPWLWNQSYPVLHPSNYHTMSAPAISPDNQWLAASYWDISHSLLYTWNLLTGEPGLAIPHPAEVNSVAFSPDGRTLASGCEDGLVRLFNPLTGRLQRVLTGFMDRITKVRFSADGSQLEINVYDHPSQVYDLASGQVKPLVTPETTPDPFISSMHQQGYADGDDVLFSPDGRSLAIGGKSVQLWDLSNRNVIISLENPYGYLLGWAFSPDGTSLAGITSGGDVMVWNISSGQLILNLSSEMLAAGQVFYASGGGIGPGIGGGVFTAQGLAFSPNGRQLAFGNGNAIEIWDIARAVKVTSLVQPKAPAYATRVSFSADGSYLYAVINRNRDAQVWDVQTRQLLKQLKLPDLDPNAFSATDLNGPLFARNNYDDTGYWIELWNLDTGEMLKLQTPARDTEPLRFSPDGSLLIAISYNYGRNILYFWKTATGQLLDWMKLDSYTGGLAISPDNDTLAIGQEGIAHLWNISALRDAVAQESFTPAVPPPTATPWLDLPTKTPLATQIVTFPTESTLPEGAILPENAAQTHELGRFGNGILNEIIWSTDANIPTITLLAAGSQGVFTYSSDPFTQTAHLPTIPWIESVARLTNGEILAAGVISQSVQIWNVSTDSLLVELPGLSPVHLNQEGNLLVYGDTYGNLHTFDLTAGQPITTLYSAYTAQIPIFSPDDRLVAAVDGYESRLGAQDFVRIWDAHSGAIVNAVGGVDADITDLSFSLDGKYLVGAGAGSAWVWEVRPGANPYTITLYTSEMDGNLTLYHQRVTAAALNPNSRILAVGDSERNIWLYNRATRGLIHRLEGHSSAIEHLRFSPDGAQLLSSDQDGNLILWSVYTGKPIASLAAYTSPVRGLVFGLDGDLRAWEANTAWVLHPPDGSLVQAISIYSGTIFAASPTGDWLAVSSRLRMSVWDALSGELEQLLEGRAGWVFVDYMYEGVVQQGFYQAAFSPDGAQLTTQAAGGTWVYDIQADNQFQLTEYTQLSPIQALDDMYERTASSTDGGLNAKTSQRWESQPLLILSNNVGQEINRLSFPKNTWITSLAFSPDAHLIAVGQFDGSIALVDVAAWKVIATLTGHQGAVNALAFSADGMTLASASDDGTVRFWGIKVPHKL
jgi:WD40 repeat protein